MKGNAEGERGAVEERISTPVADELAAFVRRYPIRPRQLRWMLLGLVGASLGLSARWLSNQPQQAFVNESLFSLHSNVSPPQTGASERAAALFEAKAQPEPLNAESLRASQALARSNDSEAETTMQRPALGEQAQADVLVIPPVWFGPLENRGNARNPRHAFAEGAPMLESPALGGLAARENITKPEVLPFAAAVSDAHAPSRGLLIPPSNAKSIPAPSPASQRARQSAAQDSAHAGLLIPPVTKPLIENSIGASAAAR